jgi:hypothetical protein
MQSLKMMPLSSGLCILRSMWTHEHITHVGKPSWPMKRLAVEVVIQRIKDKSESYFVQDARRNRAMVQVVPASAGRREHIRTYADGTPTDNLLSLNQCGM